MTSAEIRRFQSIESKLAQIEIRLRRLETAPSGGGGGTFTYKTSTGGSIFRPDGTSVYRRP